MNSTNSKVTRQRRTARPKANPIPAPIAKTPSKLDQIAALLARPQGVSVAEIMAATGWQQHSVRGAMAGALKKRGHVIASAKVGDERRYRIGAAE